MAAVDRATAEDALERIRVEYEPLPAVVDPEAAIGPDAPLLYPQLGTNVVWHDTLTYGPVDEAMARADSIREAAMHMADSIRQMKTLPGPERPPRPRPTP